MSNSTRRRRRRNHQAAKPHRDWPLTAHPSGRWCKKVRGVLHYFGKIGAGPEKELTDQAALDLWLKQKDYLIAGREPPRPEDEKVLTLEDLVNRFLTTKRRLVDSGERSPWTYQAYDEVCDQLITNFGWDRRLTDIGPDDFEALRAKWAQSWGPQRLASEINRARVVFNYAYKNGLVDRPVRFGDGFVRPSKKTLRLDREERGLKMFEGDELRAMIEAAPQPLKTMFLLAINGGLGNNDIGQMRTKALDMKGGWLSYPRPKTGIRRRIPLWPETTQALTEWLAQRPKPKTQADTDLVFLTFRGNGWTADLKDRPITKETRKLLDRLGINGSRNFYAIRHTFETVAGDSRDQIAVNAIMGHDDGSMASVYRERISDDRLVAVVNYVREWLFAQPKDHGSAKMTASRSDPT